MTYAKVIADSVSAEGHRITTMEVRFHRFVLAEFNTHRAFSRNSASSRAIPLRKQLQRIREDMAEPLSWPAEQKGMQGGAEVDRVESARETWRTAGNEAAVLAEYLGDIGVHKSVANRLLEPFMWHTVVVTSTEWQNFFDQRCSTLAQPEIRAAAELMREAYNASSMLYLKPDEWHTPYISPEDIQAVTATLDLGPNMYQEAKRKISKISAARCARVSYLTQNGIRDILEDLNLFNRLVNADPPHWSPLEHVATPWPVNADPGYNLYYYEGNVKHKAVGQRPRIGNLLGWRSLRTEHEMVSE